MVRSKFNHSKISRISVVIPAIRKCIDDEIHLYGGNAKEIGRIKKMVGLNERFVVDEQTTTADLCEKAANIILNDFDKNKIDALIFVSQTPDYFLPATACYLHGKLGLSKECAAFDMNLGCSGFVYGLWTAFGMIESSNCSNILLLAGDTPSKCVNARDRSAAPLFGDAGSATLIQRSEDKNRTYFTLNSDGAGYEHIIMPAGGFRKPKDDKTAKENADENGNIRALEDLHLNGPEVFSFSTITVPSAIEEMMRFSGKKMEDVNYVIFHQANKFIVETIARKLKLPAEKAPSDIILRYGNQSSASIPCALCETLKGRDNNNVSVILSGFGVGLSWASCLTTLYNPACSIDFYDAREK